MGSPRGKYVLRAGEPALLCCADCVGDECRLSMGEVVKGGDCRPSIGEALKGGGSSVDGGPSAGTGW